ncbi:MAG: tRNA (adenosine(37)-N6)-threonylcarbamoyltransferase complex dimerization subunit type 1 TsaB [Chitinophagaceae bacterium]
MAFLLIIDTALEQGYVGFFRNGEALGTLKNGIQKDHAAFVQKAIDELETTTKTSLQDLDAIAVVAGPGSYTGLRVGLATAKGLCYALDKKLILVNTLDVMAQAAIHASNGKDNYYVPMIDARRDDVFTGIYGHTGNRLSTQEAVTVTAETFRSFSLDKALVLSGSGAKKAAKTMQSDNVHISNAQYDISDINHIAQEKYTDNAFADVAYSEPNYLKAFYSTAKTIQ